MTEKTVHIEYELPSTGKLLLSTGVALGAAALILILFVLPAEYGLDPTGAGKLFGLKDMGDIKQSLAAEAAAADSVARAMAGEKAAKADQNETAGTALEAEPIAAGETAESGLRADTVTIRLKPGEAAELKLVMDEGAVAEYRWAVDKGHLNFDVHGDKPGTEYFGYSKGKQQTSDSGQLKAAFKGKHGWFWRNRSKVAVELVLIVSGQYKALKRVV